MQTGLKDYRAIEGYHGVRVLRSVHEDRTEFLLISLWESFDAIRKFAGDDIEKAVYYPEDREYLLELEPTVAHHELLADL